MALECDGISYRFIKIVYIGHKLGREVITEIAISPREGRILEECQLLKVVFIPETGRTTKWQKDENLST